MKMIVGLGNPGKKYEKTRHNVGFMALDELASRLGLVFEEEKKFKAEAAKNKDTIFLKPLTFMNDSGEAVAAARSFFKINTADVLIVHDEIDLPLGRIRLSRGSGSAGHKGVESVIGSLGGNDFSRLRVGVDGRDGERIETEDYVLQDFTDDETKTLKEKIIPEAVDVIKKTASFNLP